MNSAWKNRLVAVPAGAGMLYLLNLALDPAPVAALAAFVLGAIFLLWRPALPRWQLAAATALGAVCGALIHFNWHYSGSSPAPAEGLAMHLAWEGLVGWACALFSLVAGTLLLRPETGS